jgi:hypothetical protein
MGEIAKLTQHSQQLAPAELSADIIESLVVDGDIGKLRPHQRVAYYLHRCRVLGIDPGEQPFEVINLSGKIRLYCTKAGANALTRVNKLSVEIRSTSIEGTLVTVVARATAPDGRFADDIGVLDLDEEMKGRLKMSKSNAMMKCATKAKRRAVLALVGLGVLDESEADDIRGARRVRLDVQTGEIEPAATDEQHDTNRAIDVEVSEPANLGPRCSGKSAGIAESIDRKIAELSEKLGHSKSAIWRASLRRIDVSKYGETVVGPAMLTVDDGLTIRDMLAAKLTEATEPSDRIRTPEADPAAGQFAGQARPSPATAPRGEEPDDARGRVMSIWRALVNSGAVPEDERHNAFAAFAGVDSWDDDASDELWGRCEIGIERYRQKLAARTFKG